MAVNERNGSGGAGYPERDARLDRLYQETAGEAPPAHLDTTILAAARRGVGARPRPLSARLRRWRVPVSIAAVMVVSASLVMLMREEGADRVVEIPPLAPPAVQAPAAPPTPGSRPEAQDSLAARRAAEAPRTAVGAAPGKPIPEAAGPAAPAAQPAAPFSGAVGEVRRPADAPVQTAPRPALESAPAASALIARPPVPARADDAAAGGPAEAVRQKAVGGTARPVPKTAPRMDRDAVPEAVPGTAAVTAEPATVVPAQRQRAPAEARAMASGRSPAADTAAVAALLKELDQQPAEKWLEKIEELKRQGRTDEAVEALAEFKRRFPTHPLPPGLW